MPNDAIGFDRAKRPFSITIGIRKFNVINQNKTYITYYVKVYLTQKFVILGMIYS